MLNISSHFCNIF